MSITRIALAGNPNCGKTTLFNRLTGARQHVANWPGVTIEKKEGSLISHKDILIQDLPGIYSLSPYSMEEVISKDYLLNEQPEAIIDVVDASNLERNLYLTTQLCETGIPVVIALNMMDLVQKQGTKIDTKKLASRLGCEIVETSALRGTGCEALSARALALSKGTIHTKATPCFQGKIQITLDKIAKIIQSKANEKQLNWITVKVFERDEKVCEKLALTTAEKNEVESIIASLETELDDDSESIIANARYEYISQIIKECVVKKNANALTTSDKIDRIVTNRWLALPIFALVMWGVYYLSIQTIGIIGTDWVNDVLFGEWIPNALGGLLEKINCAAWLQSLILDGIVTGVGAVLGYLPQMAVLFICLALLEDSGYMARVAFVMDRIFHKFGLSGKSFIPLLVSSGCGIPGIMASRTIENDKDHKMTVLVTTFIPCQAKLPIIALIAGAFFPESSWIAPSAFFLGIAAVIITGIILKKTKIFGGEVAPFVMELPAYHIPGTKGVGIKSWERLMAFVKKAGTIILLSCALIWFLSSYSWTLHSVDMNDSMLASIGSLFAPLFTPLGWGDWKSTVASITGLVAKENLVGTFGILYGIEEVAEDGAEYWDQLRLALTQIGALSLMIFNLLCAPCVPAIGAMYRETGSGKWTLGFVAYQCIFAYIIALITYQLGGLLCHEVPLNFWQIVAVGLVGLIVYLLIRKPSWQKA